MKINQRKFYLVAKTSLTHDFFSRIHLLNTKKAWQIVKIHPGSPPLTPKILQSVLQSTLSYSQLYCKSYCQKAAFRPEPDGFAVVFLGKTLKSYRQIRTQT
jgi:hypothetical protein